jgi:hypothetical protein
LKACEYLAGRIRDLRKDNHSGSKKKADEISPGWSSKLNDMISPLQFLLPETKTGLHESRLRLVATSKDGIPSDSFAIDSNQMSGHFWPLPS